MNRKRIGTVLLLLAILAALAFIWGNSLESAVESSLKSGRVRELIEPLLELLVGQGNVTDRMVRKLAHLTEFAVLGALLLLLTAAAFRVRLQSVLNCQFFLLLAALTDETIQLFTGRGSQVRDVWLDFAGGTNFRELGGYEADEGKHIKWGQIWRGIPTCKLTGEADRAKLDALGLRLILDLRSSGEVQKEPDYVPDGARLVQICGLCAEDGHEISFAPDDIAALMKGYEESADGSTFVQAMYERMLFGNKAFKELFRALEAGETPILFHCSAGKDRTGVAAMLILLALGASDETICADYERTNLCRKAEIDAVLAEHAEEIAANPACRMRYYRKAGVDPATAPFVLRTIRAKYGSAENYLEAEYGLTPARLMRLRRMYLE